MQLNATEIFVYGAIWTAISGTIGWLAARYGVKADRRHAAKRDLLAYLKQWESEVDIQYTPGPSAGTVSGQFLLNKKEFSGHVGTIEDDYSGEKSVHFIALAKTITDMTQGKVDSADGHKALLAAIGAMIAFLKSA